MESAIFSFTAQSAGSLLKDLRYLKGSLPPKLVPDEIVPMDRLMNSMTSSLIEDSVEEASSGEDYLAGI